MPAVHKAERCMSDLDHPFYNHGARSVCGLFLPHPRIVAEISLDDEAVTCQDCLNAMMYETRETGVPCFRCKERSGLDCAGRSPDESTLCQQCLKEWLAEEAKSQAVHLASYLDGLRDGAGDQRVRDVWEKLSDEDRDELWKIIGDAGVDRILSAEPSDQSLADGQWVNRVHQPLIRARVAALHNVIERIQEQADADIQEAAELADRAVLWSRRHGSRSA